MSTTLEASFARAALCARVAGTVHTLQDHDVRNATRRLIDAALLPRTGVARAS